MPLICVTDHHDMTLAVKSGVNPNTTTTTNYASYFTIKLTSFKMIFIYICLYIK